MTDRPDRPPRRRVLNVPPWAIAIAAAAIVLLAALTYSSDWFGVRPASGSAQAMHEGGDAPGPEAAAPTAD